jgi:hypothetical protein
MRRIRAAHLLRALLRERRTRRRYSIGKKRSCSSNFWSGESARRMCRKEPTLTPVLFAKAFDKTPSRALGFASCSIVNYDLVLSGQPFVRRAAGKFKTVPSATLNNLVDLMKDGRPETENQSSLRKSSCRGPCH